MKLIGHGRAVSQLVGHGPVAKITKHSTLKPGDILVTEMTTSDLVPLMRNLAGIITETGGLLCHAAIVSRELGLPCIVGTGPLKVNSGDIVHMDATGDIWKIEPVPTV